MEGWSTLDSQAIDQLWAVYQSDSTLQACRSIIMTRILSGGVGFADANYAVVTDPEFHERVQAHYVPFCRDLIDGLCVQGFVAFYVDTKSGVPYAIPRGTGTYMQTVDKKLRRRMGFLKNGDSDVDKRVLFCIENWPDVSGAIVSPVASFKRAAGFRMMVELNTAIADYGRARPLVYTTSRTDHVFDKRFVYPEGLTLPNALTGVQDDRTSNEFYRQIGERAAMEGVNRSRALTSNAASHEEMLMHSQRQQQQLVRDLNYGVLDGRDIRLDPGTGLPVFDTAMTHSREAAYNVLPLPMDAGVATTVMPSSRTDLVPILEYSARQACVAMGVPALCIGLQNNHVTSNVTASDSALRHTLGRYRYSLSRCLLDVYTMLYGKKDGLVVLFPALLTDTEARDLFNKNIMTYPAYKEFVVNLYTVNPSFIEKEDPRQPREAPAPRPPPHKKLNPS